MASRISIFFAARRFEPLNSMGIAALQDAVEDAFPRLIARRVVDSPRVEVRGDDHGLARFVAPVDNGVDLLHHVARVSLRTQVLDEKQVVGEHAVELALAFVERLLHEVHDVADIRLKRGEAEVDDAVAIAEDIYDLPVPTSPSRRRP